MAECPNCGNGPLSPEANFCPQCGHKKYTKSVLAALVISPIWAFFTLMFIFLIPTFFFGIEPNFRSEILSGLFWIFYIILTAICFYVLRKPRWQ